MLFIVFFVDLQLFDSQSIIEKSKLKNKYKIVVMINTESNDYEFIDFVIAQKACEALNIKLVELIKYRIAKEYNDKTRFFIIHAIYSKITIKFYSKNLTSLMIIFLTNHFVILKQPWIIKHEIIVDVVATNFEKKILKWKKNHCFYLRASKISFLLLSDKKNWSNQKAIETSILRFEKILGKKLDSRIWTKNLIRFETLMASIKFKKRNVKDKMRTTAKTNKKQKMDKSWKKTPEKMFNIATIDIVSFNLLIWCKNVKIFAVSLKDIDFEITREKKQLLIQK